MGSRLPVRIRLTLWYTALLAGALLGFSGSVYLLLGHSLISNLDTGLQQRINQLMPLVDVNNNHIRLQQTAEDPDAPYVPASLLTSTGQVLGVGPPPSVRSWLRRHPAALGSRFQATSIGNLRIATAPIESNNRWVGHLLVWQSLDSVYQAQQSLLLLLLTVGPALLAIAGVGGMLLARRALSPVAAMTRTAASISATDLHQRVPVGPAVDEVSRLAITFNAMIERLEGAVERERRFTGDASHELRSPLAVILAEASLALEEPLERDDYRAALEVIYEQAAGMNEMISALLTLARVETVEGHRQMAPLAGLVERAIEQCARTGLERKVSVTSHVEPDCTVEANVALLTRAVRNLLDNAIKASPPGGVVRVHAQCTGALTVLSIEDQGPGIDPQELQRIFDPFYQVERARTPGDSHGLGLAICRRIVRAHSGEVTVSSNPGSGSTFGIVLPTHAFQNGTAGKAEPAGTAT